MMLLCLVLLLQAYLGLAASRDTLRPMPTITNSLVNLGKMEIAFHFNGNVRDSGFLPSERLQRPNPSNFLPKVDLATDEPCPCSNLRNAKDSFLSNPAGLLNKILMNNDLFSSHKDPLSSTLCCDSHEHLQEGTVVFEFPNTPKKTFASRSNNLPVPNNVIPLPNSGMPMPIMPFLFDTIIPNKSMLPPLKTKSIEIFLFPKKKEASALEQKMASKKKDLTAKENIQILGDKDFKNNMNLSKTAITPPTVKKDLHLQEKNEKQKEKEQEERKEKEELEKEDIGEQMMIIEPAGKPNAV